MFLPEAPFETMETAPTEYLRKLKNQMIEFESLGFASSLNDDPVVYAGRQLNLLQSLLDNHEIGMAYENELVGLFIKEYYLRTLLMASDLFMRGVLNMSVFFAEFKNMQKILRDVFPYWIDNDYIYSLGKNKLNIIKSINIDIPDEKSLEALLSDVAVLGMPPAVSIILPTYNRGEKLLEVLPRILNQSYKNFELIIVDDGSDDNTEEVINAFGNPKVKYIKLEQNGGQSKARNVGISNASYNFIAFADSDDIWEEKKLEIQMEKLLENHDAGFCYCAYTYYDENEKKHTVPRKTIAKVRKTGYIYPELLRRNLVGTPALVVRKECIDNVGGFNENLECLEDWEFALRLAKSYQAVFCPETLFEVYENADKVSSKTAEDGEKAMKSFYDGFERDREVFGMVDDVF